MRIYRVHSLAEPQYYRYISTREIVTIGICCVQNILTYCITSTKIVVSWRCIILKNSRLNTTTEYSTVHSQCRTRTFCCLVEVWLIQSHYASNWHNVTKKNHAFQRGLSLSSKTFTTTLKILSGDVHDMYFHTGQWNMHQRQHVPAIVNGS